MRAHLDARPDVRPSAVGPEAQGRHSALPGRSFLFIALLLATLTTLGCKESPRQVVPGTGAPISHLGATTGSPAPRVSTPSQTSSPAGAKAAGTVASRSPKTASASPKTASASPKAGNASRKPAAAKASAPTSSDRWLDPVPVAGGFVDASAIRNRTIASGGAASGRVARSDRPRQRLVGHWRWKCGRSVSEYWFSPVKPGTARGALVVNDMGTVHRGSYVHLAESLSAGTVTVRSALLGGTRTFPIAKDGQRLYEKFSNQIAIEYSFVDGGSHRKARAGGSVAQRATRDAGTRARSSATPPHGRVALGHRDAGKATVTE